ncbi:MAG TPA: glycosyltransferase family 39 protein, partial [Ktedonobacteraceae bacterium]|nr:glycosyltransferase family 39 protein [Ktedonobacteraceae bacterium]
WGVWMIPLIGIPCALAAAVLFAARLFPRLHFDRRVLVSTVGVALLALMLTSAVWSAIPVLQGQAADLPVAGPTGGTSFGAGGGSSNISVNTGLVSYLEAHKGSAKYLVAVASANEADSIILETNQPVMALGGFTGSDPILTTTQLAALVKSGEVRYFLVGGNGGGAGGSQSALITWIKAHGTVVSSSQYGGSSSGGFGGSETLYEVTSAS